MMEGMEMEFLKNTENRRILLDMKTTEDGDIILWYKSDKKIIPIASRGEMIAITGMQKSRKSLLAACLVMANYIYDKSTTLGFQMNLGDFPILHFDTEQPDRRTKINNRRFHEAIGATENLPNYLLYNIRPFSYRQRIHFIDHKVNELIQNGTPPGCIIVDQIADLVPARDYNNEVASADAMDWLVRWRDACKALLIVTIHTNRGGENTNGKLGVLVDQLTDCSFIIDYDKRTGVSKVSHKESRDQRISDFTFVQDNLGFPRFLSQKDEDFLF